MGPGAGDPKLWGGHFSTTPVAECDCDVVPYTYVGSLSLIHDIFTEAPCLTYIAIPALASTF